MTQWTVVSTEGARTPRGFKEGKNPSEPQGGSGGFLPAPPQKKQKKEKENMNDIFKNWHFGMSKAK